MGCKHSVPAAVADDAGPPESAASSPGGGREAAKRSNSKRRESLQNSSHDDGSSLDVLSSSSETTFAKDYRIIRDVGGSLSRIYLVVRNHREDHQTSAPQHQPQDDGVMGAYVMQVIDMKAVAPERREAMKEEIQSLKNISHPNSTYAAFGTRADGLMIQCHTVHLSHILPPLHVLASFCSFEDMRCLRQYRQKQYDFNGYRVMYRARFGIVRNKTVRRRPNSVNCHPDSRCRQLHAQARLIPSPAFIG